MTSDNGFPVVDVEILLAVNDVWRKMEAQRKERKAAHKNLVATLRARGRHLHEATVAADQDWDEVLYGE